MRRRPGLSLPKQPLHPNRATITAALPTPLSTCSSSTVPPEHPTKRPRSPSLAATPSPPRTPFAVSGHCHTNTDQEVRPLSSHSIVLPCLPSDSRPPACFVLPLPPESPVDPSSPETSSVAPLVTAVVFPSPAPSHSLQPQSPRHWTLAEVVERCTTWEEYLQERPVSFSGMSKSWAALDAAIRRRHYKMRNESRPLAFAHVRSYMQRQSK